MNCGPRIYSADWCFAKDPFSNYTLVNDLEMENGIEQVSSSSITTETTVNKKAQDGPTKYFKTCRSDDDCNACYSCGSDCFIEEGGQLIHSN